MLHRYLITKYFVNGNLAGLTLQDHITIDERYRPVVGERVQAFSSSHYRVTAVEDLGVDDWHPVRK